MQERNLRVLEFNKILEQLAAFAVSDAGKERARALAPSSDPADVRMLQRQTEEASMVMAYTGGSPMVYFVDVSESVRIAAIGGTLSPKALLDVAETLRASRAVRASLVTPERDNTPSIKAATSGIAPASTPISPCVVVTTSDSASSLKNVRLMCSISYQLGVRLRRLTLTWSQPMPLDAMTTSGWRSVGDGTLNAPHVSSPSQPHRSVAETR